MDNSMGIDFRGRGWLGGGGKGGKFGTNVIEQQ